MKNVKFIYACAFVFLLFFSCSEEPVSSLENEQGLDLEAVLKNYPEKITIDNWEEFVYAPKEVIEHFNQEELKLKKARKPIKAPDFDEKRLVLGSLLLGEVQVLGDGINPNTTYLGGTGVRITAGNTTANAVSAATPFFQGQNFFLSNLNGLMCFYHQNNTTGNYSFAEWVNGVSTLDIVLIQRHILGLQPFTELWQYVAADANGDGSVTVADLNVIRQLVLGVTSNLPPMATGFYNQPVIYFPQGDYDTVNANLASNLPFINTFYPVFTCQTTIANTDTDRYAIKRGDLNGSWNF
ncbi:hypothetical protein [Kordia sp.]|uniref:hypothetical protein n=1 Tax=Kordia sp. TaxID=1965332 RepID=UPI003B5925A8